MAITLSGAHASSNAEGRGTPPTAPLTTPQTVDDLLIASRPVGFRQAGCRTMQDPVDTPDGVRRRDGRGLTKRHDGNTV